ncbi:MAG TPA: hypothetical protein VHN17_09985 [Steroidobacteraceae bacterium]|jgi:hypothetical protein|nr:hypothetical protein [Steroidobacteraceae bacterium]
MEIGRPSDTYRSVRIESKFDKMSVMATGATVLVEPFGSRRRQGAMVRFPGGYIAEIHASIDN